ncbi:hypothetical protein H7U19_01050 [Hyunsoonleella sp. SJ7]|uniref:DUF3383 family protein n=1 Tax=Hyunsoonleella aquatilis TaxID=2762758 RepID=A0A923H9S4_9FLAO|nr:hypothetical protein [Hyunsoonleella aquatilis]MBC3756971.1 hypothetical protein [Hyunsoonleella aquatilis]
MLLSRKIVALFILFAMTSFSLTGQETTVDVKYKRSSLHTIMITDDTREHSETIRDIFINAPLIDKFNNHMVDMRLVPKADALSGQVETDEDKSSKHKEILSYLNTNDLAKSIVAKWFNRSETGGFNMDLVAERGHYNATDLDVKIANNSERGAALLSDAGEALIQNTFVIVNDFKYTNKEEVAKKTNSILSKVSSIASRVGDGHTVQLANASSESVEFLGKGYIIKTKAHLFKLVWNEETAAIFYNNFWTDDNNLDPEKKKAFDDTDVFKLEYIGTEISWADLQSTKLTTKTNEELIGIATIKAIDNVIAKLQRTHEVFRTKTPLIGVDPLAAKIGLKEGLEKGDKYEVLEQVLNENGIVEYQRLGIIKVDKDHIWDNRYNAEEENPSPITYTTFSGGKKKYFAGMLIRQIN